MEISELIYGDKIKVTLNNGKVLHLVTRNVGISLFWATGNDGHNCYSYKDIKKIEKDK